jgi:hypothetical protein
MNELTTRNPWDFGSEGRAATCRDQRQRQRGLASDVERVRALWAGSAIFQQAMLNPIAHGTVAVTGFPTTYAGLTYDVVNCALYGTTPTPDKTAAVGLTGYGAATSQWITGNEMTGSGYSAGGTPLASKTFTIDSGSSSFCFTAANPSWTGATIAGAFGCLVYDNTITAGTVSKQGLCYNYFGGTQSVTSGTFTVIWATVGATTAVFNITV